MRRQLLEEDFGEAPSEQGGTGTASPLDGLDMTDPWEGAEDAVDQVQTQDAGEGEWNPNAGYAEGQGEWDPQAQQPAYPEDEDDQGQYAAPQYEEQAYAPPPRRPQRPQLPPQLSETEKKFAKYGFYRLLVTQPFFDNEDPIAQEVEQEMRGFVQGRMNSLLGGDGGIEAPVGFLPDEVAALKTLAQSVIAQGTPRPRQTRPAAPPPPRRPPPPQQPTRRAPVVAAPRPPARPQMAPRPQRPAAPPPPRRPPPQYRPPQLARRPPEPPPQRRQQPQQRPQSQQQRQPPPPRGRAGVPADESVVEENGRKVKIRYREAFPGEYGTKIEAIMRRLPIGMHTRLPNGIQVLRGGAEEWIKIVRQDLTKQSSDRSGVPFPRNMTIISAEQAGNALENIRLAPGLASTISRGLHG
jgi:hypothetical protein